MLKLGRFFSPQIHWPINKYYFNTALLGHKNLQTSSLVYGHPNQLLSHTLTACKYFTFNIQSTGQKTFIILLCSCFAQEEDHGACSEIVILSFSCNSSSTRYCPDPYQRHLAPSCIYTLTAVKQKPNITTPRYTNLLHETNLAFS